MNTEREIVLRVVRSMPPAAQHMNAPFESDSEIVEIGGKPRLFTIDSYSDEDHFRIDDPYLLGKNLCTCTVSDILASGGRLSFFAHSITAPEQWDIDYLGRLADGIADVIRCCQAFFAGGDLGSSPVWNFTGVALGEAERPVTRKGARPGDLIYLTGPVGAGNFESASSLFAREPALAPLFDAHRVEFPLRLAASALMSAYASACIDTSDGLLNGLMMLSGVNGVGFEVSAVPYYPPGVVLSQMLGLPVEVLMAGECGEYELLFTVPPAREREMLREAGERRVELHRIGRITGPGTAMVAGREGRMSVEDFCLSARQFGDHHDYLAALTRYLAAKRQRG